jgi:hypothetical protein
VTVRVSVPVLPAASRAVTVSTFAPLCSAMLLAVQLVVPLAVPLPPRSFVHVTWVTPTLSDAVPPKFTVLLVVLYVLLEVGEVIVTVGAVVSGGV